MSKFLFLLSSLLLMACAHESTHDGVTAVKTSRTPSIAAETRTPATVNRGMTAPPAVEILHYNMILTAKQYDLPIDVYYGASPASEDSQKIVFYFGPSPDGSKDYPDFTAKLKAMNFHGIFVVFTGDYDGQHAQKYFSQANGFGEFCFYLIGKLTEKGWIPDVKLQFVLIGFGNGAETINKIGSSASHYFNDNSLAAGFFDAQFANGISGLETLIGDVSVGFKTYAVASKGFPDQLKAFTSVDGSSEARLSPETVLENLGDENSSISHEQLISVCLPRFLKALSTDPFIAFRCSKTR